jgi:hypothetical protein
MRRTTTLRAACGWSILALGIGLALSCSRAPSLNIRGGILAASPETVWCHLELLDRNDSRRTAGVISVRLGEQFSVWFTDGQDRIISDDSTELAVVVSCDGFTPVQRVVWRPHRLSQVQWFDLGQVAVRAKQD